MAVLAIIGAGPRGLSVLERLVCNLQAGALDGVAAASGLEIVLVDPQAPGPGQVWRRDQSPLVLMNTPAGACTIFTDPSVMIEGPVVPGPSLAQWSRTIAPGLSHLPEPLRRLAATLGDDAFAPRVLFGHYLAWTHERITKQAPAGVSIRHVRARALDMERTADQWTIALSDGSALAGVDAVVIALGHPLAGAQPPRVPHRAYAIDARNATDADLSMIAPGEAVAIRGLGLCAFDYIALLTEGRGGRFDPRADGGCDYAPSGNEPALLLGSRRGLPYRGRGPQPEQRYRPSVLTREVVDALAHKPVLDFEADLWPLIGAELIAALDGADLAVADLSGLAGDAMALLERCSSPLAGQSFADAAALTGAVLAHLRADLDDALDTSSPFRRVQGAMRLARATIREQLSMRRVSARTHRFRLAQVRDLLEFSIAGPPAHRIAQLLALHEAGIVEFVGPQMAVQARGPRFEVSSPKVAGSARLADVLVDAWLPPAGALEPDGLVARRLARGTFSFHSALIEGPALAIDPLTLAVLNPDGVPVGGCHAVGQSLAPQEWVPTIAPLGGTNSRFLRMTDRVARAALAGLGQRDGLHVSHSREDDLDYAN